MDAETLFQSGCLPGKMLADFQKEAWVNLRDIATHVFSSKKSSLVEGLTVYPKIPSTPREAYTPPAVPKDDGISVHSDSSSGCKIASPVVKESHMMESEASIVLNLVLKCFKGRNGFVFWNSCFRSVFKLVHAPRQHPSVFMEVLVMTDSKAPILFIFTNSVESGGSSSAPELDSYRISLAQALTSKIQSFIPDTICIMSSIVPWKKSKPMGGITETQEGQHSQGSVQLDDFLKTAEEEAEKYMSPKALAITAGKFQGLAQATLAALAVTTVYSKEDGKDSNGRRKGRRTFLHLPHFERICEPFLVKLAVCMRDKTVLAVEFAIRRSLEQKTLFVSNEQHVLETIEDIMRQRGKDNGLRVASYDSCFGAGSGSGTDADSEGEWVPDVIVADDFDNNYNSNAKTTERPPLLKRLRKTSTVLLGINSMGTNDLNRTIGFQIPMYSGLLKQPASSVEETNGSLASRGFVPPPQEGTSPIPQEMGLSGTRACAGSLVLSLILRKEASPVNVFSLDARSVDVEDQKYDEGKHSQTQTKKHSQPQTKTSPNAQKLALHTCSEEARKYHSLPDVQHSRVIL